MKTVQVLMSSYNGEKYIKEQIESILNQKNVNIKLLIRDDGSSDNTLEILREYQKRNNISIIYGKNLGYKKSFLTLVDFSEEADYYAFSDQDDVWLDDKIYSGIKKIEKQGNNKPMLYCSALQRVNERLYPEKTQKFNKLKLDVYSQLVRERLAGCTFVFNKRLKNLIKGSSSLDLNYPHDSWTILVCYSCGGQVVFDDTPHILFRRYGTNTSVDGGGLIKRLRHEFRYFRKYKDQRYDTVRLLLRFRKNDIQEKKFLYKITNYKKSFGNTIKLAFDKRLDCGMKIPNIINRVVIICRCF